MIYFKDENFIRICETANHNKGLKDSQKPYSYGGKLISNINDMVISPNVELIKTHQNAQTLRTPTLYDEVSYNNNKYSSWNQEQNGAIRNQQHNHSLTIDIPNFNIEVHCN